MGAVTQILRWTAGAPAVPQDQDFDDRVLLGLIGQHALSGRLARRLPTGPAWLRDRLGGPAAAMHADTLAHADAHIRAVDRIVAALGEQQPPPVVVKGIATGLLTGDKHLLRCGDIDLVCADGGPLTETLTRLGYERTRPPFLHELGEFTREGVEIDVHAYVPVPGYGAVRGADLTPPQHAQTWYQPRRAPSMTPVRHGQLVDGAVTVGPVTVPGPCLLAIVLCAHAFLNFTNMWSLSHRAKPYVKLGELADLHALVQHEDFDTTRFLALAEELDAGDAVSWAGWALNALLGRNPLPVPAATGPFPRCLWWDFWARLPIDEEALLLPDWFDPATVNPLLPGRTELDTGCPTPPWTVEVLRDGNLVTVIVGLPDSTDAAAERGRVDFGVIGTEWVLADGRLTAAGGHDTCDLLSGRRVRLRYRIPRTGGQMLVGVAEQDTSGALLSAVLLPVTGQTADEVGAR
ncbi:nucleotidyltransferase family protein [Streptomyces acidiscabies]|uniref:Nucleotidyltransferase family protein n=1 Tax=Streptomyces acidiscabies TaxID=42234 RepID=A0ABU4ME44_9ACTN|nr:nucleotidyltransferase family protein [Streptomyces acidiscabies]MDX3025794.1 nucleotidyltransferase family protein [Streptomyces acidiscabies]